MSAPNASFEMDSLDEKVVPLATDTLLLKDTADNDQLKQIKVDRIQSPFTWAASDEDSPLITGLLYTTEAAITARIFTLVEISVKNAPTGTTIEISVFEESVPGSNNFDRNMFTTNPQIDVGKFNSLQSAQKGAFAIDHTWEIGARLQISLVTNDTPNFAATGIKVSLQ